MVVYAIHDYYGIKRYKTINSPFNICNYLKANKLFNDDAIPQWTPRLRHRQRGFLTKEEKFTLFVEVVFVITK